MNGGANGLTDGPSCRDAGSHLKTPKNNQPRHGEVHSFREIIFGEFRVYAAHVIGQKESLFVGRDEFPGRGAL